MGEKFEVEELKFGVVVRVSASEVRWAWQQRPLAT